MQITKPLVLTSIDTPILIAGNGVIGTAATTVLKSSHLVLDTASAIPTATLTLATDPALKRGTTTRVENKGSFGTAFSIHGITVNPNTWADFNYNGTAWNVNKQPVAVRINELLALATADTNINLRGYDVNLTFNNGAGTLNLTSDHDTVLTALTGDNGLAGDSVVLGNTSQNNSATANAVWLQNGNNSGVFVKKNGRVGVNTSTPGNTFEVSGSFGLSTSSGITSSSTADSVYKISTVVPTADLPPALNNRIITIVNKANIPQPLVSTTYINLSNVAVGSIAANSAITLQGDGTVWQQISSSGGSTSNNNAYISVTSPAGVLTNGGFEWYRDIPVSLPPGRYAVSAYFDTQTTSAIGTHTQNISLRTPEFAVGDVARRMVYLSEDTTALTVSGTYSTSSVGHGVIDVTAAQTSVRLAVAHYPRASEPFATVSNVATAAIAELQFLPL